MSSTPEEYAASKLDASLADAKRIVDAMTSVCCKCGQPIELTEWGHYVSKDEKKHWHDACFDLLTEWQEVGHREILGYLRIETPKVLVKFTNEPKDAT